MRGHSSHKRVKLRRRYAAAAAAMMLAVLSTTPQAAAQTATDGFLDRLGELAGQAADLLERTEVASAAWEAREVGFQDTLDGLREVETDAALLLAAVQEIVPPSQFVSLMDQLAATASDVSASASATVAGFRASDSGETRQAAQAQLRENVSVFQNLVAGAQANGTTTTSTTIAATTTTVPNETTTTSAGPATTTTTLAIELAAGNDGADDGGAPWALVPIALMAGLAFGVVGGLLLGANSRRKLIDQAKTGRGRTNGAV